MAAFSEVAVIGTILNFPNAEQILKNSGLVLIMPFYHKTKLLYG